MRFVDEPAPPASAFASVDLVMQSCQDDYQVSVRVICCPEWPHTAAAGSPHHLVEGVQQATLKYQNGPIVVVDRFVENEMKELDVWSHLGSYVICGCTRQQIAVSLIPESRRRASLL